MAWVGFGITGERSGMGVGFQLFTKMTLTGEWYDHPRGRMLIGKLPFQISEPRELNGLEVIVDNESYCIIAVELFTHMPPWRQGESCGFLLEASPQIPKRNE